MHIELKQKNKFLKNQKKVSLVVSEKDLINLISTERRTNENLVRGECEKLTDLLINSGEKNWIKDENVFRDVII